MIATLRMIAAIGQVGGKRLTYRTLAGPEI